MSPRKINEAGLDIIKTFEGFRREAYLCPAGIWTVGYGHTKNVLEGLSVSTDEAELYLQQDVQSAAKTVERFVKAPMNNNEFSALVSFVFNVGAGNFSISTMLKKLNAGDDKKSIADEFQKWNKAGGKVLIGLISRRKAEARLFLTPITS